MTLSTFDGEPARELHEHYDPDGQLTGTTVVMVPGWSDEDRAWARGLAEVEARECSRCGGDLAETLDPAYVWVPQEPHICYRCVALRSAAKRNERHPYYEAMIFTVRKVLAAVAKVGRAVIGESPHEHARG